jgi:hypothetical protein
MSNLTLKYYQLKNALFVDIDNPNELFYLKTKTYFIKNST